MSDMFNKAKDLAGDHSEQVTQGMDQAQDFANEKTGGQYSDQIQQGGDFVEGQLGLGGDGQAPEGQPQEEQQPPQ